MTIFSHRSVIATCAIASALHAHAADFTDEELALANQMVQASWADIEPALAAVSKKLEQRLRSGDSGDAAAGVPDAARETFSRERIVQFTAAAIHDRFTADEIRQSLDFIRSGEEKKLQAAVSGHWPDDAEIMAAPIERACATAQAKVPAADIPKLVRVCTTLRSALGGQGGQP